MQELAAIKTVLVRADTVIMMEQGKVMMITVIHQQEQEANMITKSQLCVNSIQEMM